jgi:hypothetical protein
MAMGLPVLHRFWGLSPQDFRTWRVLAGDRTLAVAADVMATQRQIAPLDCLGHQQMLEQAPPHRARPRRSSINSKRFGLVFRTTLLIVEQAFPPLVRLVALKSGHLLACSNAAGASSRQVNGTALGSSTAEAMAVVPPINPLSPVGGKNANGMSMRIYRSLFLPVWRFLLDRLPPRVGLPNV